jgi:hypothetical protein
LYAYRAQTQQRWRRETPPYSPCGGEKEISMKHTNKAGAAVLALSLLMSLSAFAGSKDSGGSSGFELSRKTIVAGTELKPGVYKLAWEGSGPEVKVQFKQGRNVVATSNARVVELPGKDRITAAVLNGNSNGAPTLAEARMAGKRFKLVFDGTSEAANHSQAAGGGQQ